MLESSPENTLRKACRAFNEVTGMEFQAMGELEYYVIAEDDGAFAAVDQKGYHESAPYAKFGEFRQLCMNYIAQTGGRIKYGHSEVGNFSLNGKIYEQNEIEFLPVNAVEAAEQLLIAKWLIRNLAYRNGLDVTFAPKITVGKAGSGMHIHFRLMKDGLNQMLKDKKLSDDAYALYERLSKTFNCEFDEAGAIGRRYRRQDEIGTPFCITYDFDSKEDGCVTVRDRDTIEQLRMPISEVKAYIESKLEF